MQLLAQSDSYYVGVSECKHVGPKAGTQTWRDLMLADLDRARPHKSGTKKQQRYFGFCFLGMTCAFN